MPGPITSKASFKMNVLTIDLFKNARVINTVDAIPLTMNYVSNTPWDVKRRKHARYVSEYESGGYVGDVKKEEEKDISSINPYVVGLIPTAKPLQPCDGCVAYPSEYKSAVLEKAITLDKFIMISGILKQGAITALVSALIVNALGGPEEVGGIFGALIGIYQGFLDFRKK
jgi:hypothetical protein